ncbi:hypothetical protein [Dyadobacter luticola]|uniref:Uncharacterized protein n=1 Tax=Dyadobacter luticola TaxID=1979387 RepID=A0A5R9KRV9_9BACT|nr:hypothetical protein [Dyadobacter luticola]TLU98953.1 hypothetical protein FEN17_20400 [Dyadobacter luticola]
MDNMLNAAAGAGGAASGQAGKWFSGLTKLKSVILISSTVLSVSAVVIYKTFNADIESNNNQKSARNIKSEITINAPSEVKAEHITENTSNNIDSVLLESKGKLSIKSDSTFSNNADSEKLTFNERLISSGSDRNNTEKSVSHEKMISSNIGKPKDNSENIARFSKRTNQVKFNNSKRTNRAEFNNSENNNSAVSVFRNDKRFSKSANQGNEKHEVKTDLPNVFSAKKTEPILSAEKQINIQILKSRNAQFANFDPHLTKKVIAKNPLKQPEKEKITSDRSFHVGLDWSLNSSLNTTKYLLTGADSINHIGRHVIPGIFVTKNWKKSSATFTFSPYQSYFGDNKTVSRLPDSSNTDSSKSYHNKRFLKSTGLNFSLQYQYHLTRLLALNAGVSYSLFTAALFRPQFENWQGKFLDEKLSTLKSKEMSQYITPHLFAVKAGLAFTPGRFQLGFNVILPLNNVSKSQDFPLRTLNGQVYLRFLVW